jgi:spermidine synthase
MAFGERRMGHLPLLLHPDPQDVLILGVGTGATAGAVTSFDLRHVDAIELVPAVLDQLHYFDAINGMLREAPNVDLHAADARRWVSASDATYDVVIADLFHPARDGAGSLYAREHFDNVRAHLRPGGTFTQWLPLYQLDDATLRLIVRTFVDVFDESYAWLGIYNVQTPAVALVGRVDDDAPLQIELAALRTQLTAPIYDQLLMSDPRDLLGAYLMDRDGLVAFAGEGPLNTDMHPRVATGAPRSAYLEDPTRGRTNLADLLAVRTPLPPGILGAVDAATEAAVRQDAAAFGRALELYLRAEAARVEATANDANAAGPPMTAIEGYLQAYEAAPDFVPARGMLYLYARQSAAYGAAIYPRMLARTPADPRVYQAFGEHLRRTGDQAAHQRLMQQAADELPPPRGRSTRPAADGG